jgi:hypothetical protein
LAAAVRAHPPLADLAPSLEVSEPRCADRWATVAVAAAGTDRALAVLERSGDGWRVLLVGDSEPCAGLGLPDAVAQRLACPTGPG